jgi:uncharacterized protein (TIGR02271 family)
MTPAADDRPDPTGDEQSLIRHEERLGVTKRVEEIGAVRLRKHTETGRVTAEVPRGLEHAQVQKAPPSDTDSGEVETLPDGSISIPVFEEELVISRRLVVRERIVVKKQTVYQPERITEEVRREHVEVEHLDPSGDESGKELT